MSNPVSREQVLQQIDHSQNMGNSNYGQVASNLAIALAIVYLGDIQRFKEGIGEDFYRKDDAQ